MLASRSMTRSFARRRVQRFDWQKIVGPRTPEAFVGELQAKQAGIASKVAAARSLPGTVEAINWAEWEKAIKEPGVVAALKKEYESMSFPTISTADFAEEFKHNEEIVKQAEAAAKGAKVEALEAQKLVDALKTVKAKGVNVTLEDFENLIPGMHKQFHAEYDNEEYMPEECEFKADTLDYKVLKDQLEAGADITEGIEVKEQLGDLNVAAEEALIEENKWSVSRLLKAKA